MGLPKFAEFLSSVGFEKPSGKDVSNDEIFEFVPITVDDLKRRGVWKNAAGERMRVNADTLKTTTYNNGEGETFFDSLEAIQKKLTEKQYVFVPATNSVDRADSAQTNETFDQATVQDDQDRILAVLDQLQQDSIEHVTDIRSGAPTTETIVSASKSRPAKKTTKGKNNTLSGPETTPDSSGDGGDGTGIDGIVAASVATEDLLKDIRTRLGEDTSGVVAELIEIITLEKKVVDEEIALIQEEGRASKKKLQELAYKLKDFHARTLEAEDTLKALSFKKSPEDRPSLDDVLEETKKAVERDIAAITTPAEYAAFRRENMFKLPSKNDDGSMRYYIVNVDKIRDSLGVKKLEPKTFDYVTGAFEEEFRNKLRQKFSVLKKEDLAEQSRRWREALKEAKDVPAMDSLMTAWSQDNGISETWKAIKEDLSSTDWGYVTKDYAKRFDEFKWELACERELRVFLTESGDEGARTLQMHDDTYRVAWQQVRKTIEEIRGRISSEQEDALWSLLDDRIRPLGRQQLMEDLQKRYGVDEERTEKIVTAVLDKWIKKYPKQ